MPGLTASQGVAAAHRCPSCGSDDTASLRSIWEHGTTDTTTVGIGVVGDQLGYGGAVSGTSSRAAQRAAPPGRPSLLMSVVSSVMGMLLGFASLLNGLFDASWPWPDRLLWLGVGVPMAAVFVFAGVRQLRHRLAYGRNDHSVLLARWARTWSCRRCGATYEPGGGPTT